MVKLVIDSKSEEETDLDAIRAAKLPRALRRQFSWWSVVPMGQGCRFHAQSGRTQEPTNECMKRWNSKPSKSMFLSRSQINT